jgi:hypothetical protein
MPGIEERLPRAIGHAINASISLLLWRGIILAWLGFVHWVATLAH